MTVPLNMLSCADLLAAKAHIEDLIKFAGEEMQKNPGPGWDPVFAMLERNLADVKGEIKKKR